MTEEQLKAEHRDPLDDFGPVLILVLAFGLKVYFKCTDAVHGLAKVFTS